jgi:hypothetical protein
LEDDDVERNEEAAELLQCSFDPAAFDLSDVNDCLADPKHKRLEWPVDPPG